MSREHFKARKKRMNDSNVQNMKQQERDYDGTKKALNDNKQVK